MDNKNSIPETSDNDFDPQTTCIPPTSDNEEDNKIPVTTASDNEVPKEEKEDPAAEDVVMEEEFDESALFVVENAGNTCYIDSLLMGLLYVESHIDAILKNKPRNENHIYLQEFIKSAFVDQVRTGKSVTRETMDTLRYILLNCGWLDYDSVISQQDVNEFFSFLCSIFNINMIEMNKETYSIAGEDGKSKLTESIQFIPLAIPYNEELKTCPLEKVMVKDMLYDWLYSNEVTVKRTISQKGVSKELDVDGLSVYHITNIPEFVALSINRFPTIERRLDTDVIIQKRLCPFRNTGNPSIKDIEWHFHAAICHRGETLKSGHYYTLLCKNTNPVKNDPADTKWYIFDDLEQPCMRIVSMKDPKVIGKIKKECVFLIYTLGFLK